MVKAQACHTTHHRGSANRVMIIDGSITLRPISGLLRRLPKNLKTWPYEGLLQPVATAVTEFISAEEPNSLKLNQRGLATPSSLLKNCSQVPGKETVPEYISSIIFSTNTHFNNGHIDLSQNIAKIASCQNIYLLEGNLSLINTKKLDKNYASKSNSIKIM